MQQSPAPRVAFIIGFDFHARALARVMNAHSAAWRFVAFSARKRGLLSALARLAEADAVICYGGPGPSAPLDLACRIAGVPVYVLWAGSDVNLAKLKPDAVATLTHRRYVHGAVSPWLAEELDTVGISATTVDVSATDPVARANPLPGAFTVLSYLPEPSRVFYGRDRIYTLARALPDVEFTIVGVGRPDPAPPNVRFLGFADDIGAAIDASTVLVRLPEHDGHSAMVNEALVRGRHAVWTHAVPGVHAVRDTNEALEVLRDLRRRHEAGTLGLNAAGMDLVAERFTPARVAASVEAFLARPSERHAARERRVAVSGLTYFSAKTAQFVGNTESAWQADLLDGSSRLRKLDAMWTLARSDVWYTIGSPIVDPWFARVAAVLRKPRVMHWVGSDIGLAANDPGLARRIRSSHAVHLAEVGWTAAQLAKLGIDATVAALPVGLSNAQPEPLPDVLTLLLYVPRFRGAFYGTEHYARLVAALAGEPVRFLVVGGGTLDVAADAPVEYLGWVSDLQPVYARVSALIRFTKHDGLSLMVLEALSAGRHVFWTQDFPFTTRLTDYASLERGVRDLLAQQKQGGLAVRSDAHAFVHASYATESCVRRLEAVWDAASKRNSVLHASTVPQ